MSSIQIIIPHKCLIYIGNRPISTCASQKEALLTWGTAYNRFVSYVVQIYLYCQVDFLISKKRFTIIGWKSYIYFNSFILYHFWMSYSASQQRMLNKLSFDTENSTGCLLENLLETSFWGLTMSRLRTRFWNRVKISAGAKWNVTKYVLKISWRCGVGGCSVTSR